MLTDRAVCIGLASWTRIVHFLKAVVTESVKIVLTVMGMVVPGAVIAAMGWIVAMEFATIIVITTAAKLL